MKLLKVARSAQKTYRKTVRGCENISTAQMEAKLTRNVELSHKIPLFLGHELCIYGKLWMVVRVNKVVWIKNHQPVIKGWKKDWDKYIKLSKELGIRD